tara:strand:+ start:1672 stop:5367 length:3696 start_codon:yes stop_codon:yes gene_type:complete
MAKKDSLQTTPRLVKEVPSSEYKEEIRNGKKVYVRKSEKPIPKEPVPVKPKPTNYKPSGTPKKFPPPKPKPVEPDFVSEEDVVYLEEPTPKETVLKSSVQTYGNRLPRRDANQTFDTFEFADSTGNTTNKALKANFEGDKEITFDDKGNKIFTGKTLEDFRNKSIQQIETPMMSGVNKPNPNKIQEFSEQGITFDKNASGGIGVNKSTLGTDLKGATDTYIPKRYDLLGKEIITPNTGLQPLGTGIANTKEVGRMYDVEKPIEIKGKYAKGGVISKIKGYYEGGNVYDPNKNIDGTYGDGVSSYKPLETTDLNSGVVGQNDQYSAQKQIEEQKTKDAGQKKANQDKARAGANMAGQALGGVGSAYYNSQTSQNEGEATRNAGLAAASQMGPIGGMIGGIAAIGDKAGKPTKTASEKVDASGELLDEGKAKRNAAIGITFSPSKRLTYEGGLTDITGQKYIDSIEKKTKAQLAEVNAANVASKQQQAIAARNNQEENPTITNPYNLSGVTFDENQNMVLANNQQFDPNRPMYKKGGLVSKAMGYADGGEIKGKGTAKSDSIKAKVKEGSFVVPAENAELAKGIRKLYLKAPNKKANLNQEDGESVYLSRGEELFTPEENEYLESIGIELEDLAPNSEENNEEMRMGGMLKRADGSYSERGLWDNIRANTGSGKAPTTEMLKQEKKIKDSYAGGGYVVQASSDREGKTHKVTGPDGTVKYFGDPNLGQHPKDLERKKAFYARHKDNLDNNPHFRAYARTTWAEGGEIMAPKMKGYAAGGEVDEVDPIKELARLNKEKQDNEKAGKVESDAAKAARDKKIADFNAKVASYDRKADRKDKASEWDKKRNDSKTKLDALNKSYEDASKEFEAANTPTAAQKAKGVKAGALNDTQRKYQEGLLKKIQEAKSEFDNAERTYNYIKDDNNYDASGNIKTKPKTATTVPKIEVKPSVVTENVAPTKPSLKAPKVNTSKVTVDNLPTNDLSLQGLKQDAELKVANQAAMQEASIANAPTRQAVINDANVTNNENYLAAKPKSKNAWANKLNNVDPTAFVGIGQAALGLNMLGKEKRPIDNAVIDPTYNAAVNRAQQDALFGLTPEQRFMAEQDIQGGLNDAKFAGLNSSASDSFNRNRAAINDAWRNKLGLKQADSEMRMNKQKYADVMAADRASILAGNRRTAFNDAMNTFQQKQQAGSELVGAGLANTIGAYRFKQDQQARLKADEARGYSLNNYNPTV